nr:ATP-binding protein [Sphingomonas jinjuensis]
MLELRSRDAELDFLAHGTVGREAELRKLTSFVRRVWRAGPSEPRLSLFMLAGIGGIGKSTLAADFARNHLPREYADPVLLWIDYDRLRVRPEDVGTVLMEVSRQLGWAMPWAADALRQARAALRSEQSGRDGRTDYRAAIDSIAHAVVGSGRERLARPVLLVLDTFEQVDRVPGQTVHILGALDSLRSRMFDSFAVLACGRSLFTAGFGEVAVNDQTEDLEGLGREASVALLTGRGGLRNAAALRFVAAFADLGDRFRTRVGIPMLLMLVARLARDGHFLLDGNDVEQIREATDAAAATAYIYGRILERLPTELRALAHPGLAVPEVSADVIEHVVWPAVHPDRFPPGSERAQDLYRQLSHETWLVDPVPGSMPPRVRHRPDLRRAMLQAMRKDAKACGTMLSLHQRAFSWHRDELRSTPDRQSNYHRLGQVYHGLQVAALSGRSPGVGMTAIRSVRDQLVFLVEDFDDDYQPAVRALIGEDVDPGLLAPLDRRLRASVLTERVRAYATGGDPVAGLRYAASLDVTDRSASPSVARWILRSYFSSGRWLTGAPVVNDLVDRPDAVAYDFGRGRPSLLTFLAASQVAGPHAIREALRMSQRRGGTQAIADLYQAIDLVLVLVERPGAKRREELRGLLERLVMSQPPKRRKGDGLTFAQMFGALQRLSDPARHDVSSFVAAAKRGAHAVGIATMHDLNRRSSGRSSAQLVASCRSLEAKIDKGDVPLHAQFVSVFDDLHAPLGESLAAGVTGGDELFRLAEFAWNSLEVRPSDLRPSRFVEDCADPRQRRERMRTLVAFLDRSAKLDGFLRHLGAARIADSDALRVADFALRFRSAFGAERD